MYYIKAVFNAESFGKLEYGFKINMLCNELEVIYNNFQGGYTNKGIKLNTKQHNHLKNLLKIDRFEKFRNNLNKEDNYLLFLDPYTWNLQCISNDGIPMLQILNEDVCYYAPPNSVIDLVKYVIKIGIEREVFEKMRLL